MFTLNNICCDACLFSKCKSHFFCLFHILQFKILNQFFVCEFFNSSKRITKFTHLFFSIHFFQTELKMLYLHLMHFYSTNFSDILPYWNISYAMRWRRRSLNTSALHHFLNDELRCHWIYAWCTTFNITEILFLVSTNRNSISISTSL